MLGTHTFIFLYNYIQPFQQNTRPLSGTDRGLTALDGLTFGTKRQQHLTLKRRLHICCLYEFLR